jgi:predicted nucleic acid-binding protein
MIFVDTWAWIALADASDQYHRVAVKQHRKLVKNRRKYVTSDFVVTELINYLYSAAPADQARQVINELLQQVQVRIVQLVHVSPAQFFEAWRLRQKYHDKPDISFTDFTSMVVMQDLGMTDIFTGDAHFLHVGLGFRLFPPPA